MRSAGKWALVLGMTLWLVAALAAGEKPTASGAKSKVVHKSGTVEAGAEAGCLMVRDVHDHALYNVSFGSGAKPKVGDNISFTGTRHDSPNICMQGIPVRVSTWKPVKGKPENTTAK